METKFNFKSQICTDKIQSERLLALGLKNETADMKYPCTREYYGGVLTEGTSSLPIIIDTEDDNITEYDTPAWSIARLIEMMPGDVIPEGGYDNSFTLIKTYPKGYNIEYDGFSYYHKENIYDTLIERIEDLIKAGYFNKKYLARKRSTRRD